MYACTNRFKKISFPRNRKILEEKGKGYDVQYINSAPMKKLTKFLRVLLDAIILIESLSNLIIYFNLYKVLKLIANADEN